MRRLPPGRNFLVAAGLEQALDFLETLAFDDDALAWLDTQGGFSRALLDHLRGLRFTGGALFHLMLDLASGRKKTWAEHWKLHKTRVLFNPAPIT